MSILVVLIPPRARLRAHSAAEGAEADGRASTAELHYVLSDDGFSLDAQGRCAAALLPRATMVVAALADADVSWHRIILPRAPAARLPAALQGVLEEAVLDDTADVHLAVAPQAIAGQPTWIAAVNRPWLARELAALERATVFVDRVVPMSWPDDPPSGHFADVQSDNDSAMSTLNLTWSHPDGVATMRLQGGLARSLLPTPLPSGVRWSASAGAASTAEKALGIPIPVMTPAMRALQATRTTWNLRQFDLAPRHRGTRALRDAMRHFMAPGWRPVRIGLAALAALHIVGLNLYAWQQRAELEERRTAMVNLLRTTYPQVRAVLDAPVQMQRETDALRVAAGRAGDADLEPMLAATAFAWPAERPPVENLRFEPGRLTLAAVGWGNQEIEQFRSRLRPTGWQVDHAEGRLIVSRSRLGVPQ
jgi:general secretion pathway protein L